MTNSNLGGLCGLICSGKWDHDSNGATAKVRRYDEDSGECNYAADSAANLAAAPPCLGAHELYYTQVATTQSGTQVDMRITNASTYHTLKHTANGLSGIWGVVQVLSNTQTDFLFEFVDNVRTALTRTVPVAGRIPRYPPFPADQPPLNQHPLAPFCRSLRPQSRWTSSASHSSTSIPGATATRRW